MTIQFWLKRPQMAIARIRYWIWEKMNPDKPWMCPGTIEFCESNLSSSMTALEFGSGRSTRWFSTLVGHLTSVEQDPQWYEQVEQELAAAEIANVNYLLVPLDHPAEAPERDEYSPVPNYVAVVDSVPDRHLDFAVVDGHYRNTCIKHLVKKIAPGGYLLVDDVNMWSSLESLPIPPQWRVADDSTNGIKRCIIWQATRSLDRAVSV